MPDLEYTKSHEFDRVLNYYRAEQEMSSVIFATLNLHKAAKMAIEKLDDGLEESLKASLSIEDRTPLSGSAKPSHRGRGRHKMSPRKAPRSLGVAG